MTHNSEPHYAGFWIRLVADIIDSLLLTVVSWLLQLIIMGVVFWVKWFEGNRDVAFFDVISPFFTQVLNVILYGAIAAPYYIVGHHRYGTTLGKRPLHVYVVNEKDLSPLTVQQSVTRFCSYLLSYVVFATGFLMAAFHPKKRALHDLIAGTVSIRKMGG